MPVRRNLSTVFALMLASPRDLAPTFSQVHIDTPPPPSRARNVRHRPMGEIESLPAPLFDESGYDSPTPTPPRGVPPALPPRMR